MPTNDNTSEITSESVIDVALEAQRDQRAHLVELGRMRLANTVRACIGPDLYDALDVTPSATGYWAYFTYHGQRYGFHNGLWEMTFHKLDGPAKVTSVHATRDEVLDALQQQRDREAEEAEATAARRVQYTPVEEFGE